MPYLVRPDGSIECDSPEEAIRLSRLLAGTDGAAKQPKKEVAGRTEHVESSNGRLLLARLAKSPNGENQRKVLALLLDHDSVRMEEIGTKLGMDSGSAISGVLAGLSKNLKALKIDREDVIVKREQGRPPNVVRTYSAGPLLRQMKIPDKL